MPTYEYECRTCGFVFERVQNMSDDPVRDCPECGQAVRRNIFGGSGVIFKGSGFYVNDSKGKNSAAPAASKSNAGDSAAAPAAGGPGAGNSGAGRESGNATSGTAPAGANAGSSEQKKTAAPPAPAGSASQSGSKSSRE